MISWIWKKNNIYHARNIHLFIILSFLICIYRIYYHIIQKLIIQKYSSCTADNDFSMILGITQEHLSVNGILPVILKCALCIRDMKRKTSGGAMSDQYTIMRLNTSWKAIME
jgi:hypothetical protein